MKNNSLEYEILKFAREQKDSKISAKNHWNRNQLKEHLSESNHSLELIDKSINILLKEKLIENYGSEKKFIITEKGNNTFKYKSIWDYIKRFRLVLGIIVAIIGISSFFIIRPFEKEQIPQEDEKELVDPIDTSQNGTVTTTEQLPINNYRIIGIKSLKLTNTLKRKLNCKYNKNSGMTIRFGFSGKIEELQNGLYRYNGGFVELYMSNKKCYLSTMYKLKRTLSAGNSHSYVEEDIYNQIEMIITNNIETISKDLNQCLK
jgi:hypothetical protein